MTMSKIRFLWLREGASKIKAQVIEYRKAKGPMRNDYTLLDYPYVKILTEGPDKDKVRRLKYTDSWRRPFKIGEVVDVFWSGDELLYWHAMENGLTKYLPSKWTLRN